MKRARSIPHAEQLDELEARFPGWQVWVSGDNWSARPEPLINASSPEALAARIRAAHSSPPAGSPALAAWRSYLARVRTLRGFEETAGRTWQRMRAEKDRWPRIPRVHRERHAQREPGTGVTVTPGPEQAARPDTIA